MSASASLIPELEDVLQHGSPERCAEVLAGITSLFLRGASRFNDNHVALFDAVFVRLIENTETQARAELSIGLAPMPNAPLGVVERLASDNDLSVAAPMLKESPRLTDATLQTIARTKGQGHLLAISSRNRIGEIVTDVLIERGDREVVRAVADNSAARLSEDGLSMLVDRAADDGVLAAKLGRRADIPSRLFRTPLMQATEVVQQRLLARASPETAAEIRRVLAKISEEIGVNMPAPRDYAAAKKSVMALKQGGKLDEPALHDFAKTSRFEETVVALAELSGVPIETVERLMLGERPDPVLILCKAAGFSWATVRATILVRPNAKGTSTQGLDTAYTNFERLSPATAQRVTRFWQIRQAVEAA